MTIPSPKACMIPGFCVNRRNIELRVEIDGCGSCRCNGLIAKDLQLLYIPLFYYTKSPKFSFKAIEVSIMICIPTIRVCTSNLIKDFHSFDHLDRKRNPRYPRLSCCLVLQAELG